MKKKNKGGKLIIVIGVISIVLVTICAFNKENIKYKYYEYTMNKKYSSQVVNEYYIEDNFNYVENYTDIGIKNKEELINFIYYTLNSGIPHTERYIKKEYTNYQNDINILSSNNGKDFKEIISLLNNFVHPYNSSNNININYGGKYKIGITINNMIS